MQKATDEEVAKAIVSFFPDTTEESLAMVAKSYRAIDAWMDSPVMKEEAFNRLQDIIIQAGVLNDKVDFADVVDITYAQKVVNTFN